MLGQAAALPATSVATLIPAQWNTDGSLIGGGEKGVSKGSLTALVSNPSSAKVTNDQAVTIDDRGTAGSNTHLNICGPPSAYPAYGFGGTWINYPDMFNNNKQSMKNNGATDQEIGWIYDAINTVAAKSLVDRRVVSLAIRYYFCAFTNF
jgi:hypothetical protein